MSDNHPVIHFEPTYIVTPRAVRRPEKISSVLERRMKKFVRARQRQLRKGKR